MGIYDLVKDWVFSSWMCPRHDEWGRNRWADDKINAMNNVELLEAIQAAQEQQAGTASQD